MVHDYTVLILAENATERDRTRLIASVSHLNTVSSKTVS